MHRLHPPTPARERSADASQAVHYGLTLLARRPRTEADLRQRLGERFEPAAVGAALGRLTELGYVDDTAWAAGYLERPRSAERSARMLRAELRERGIEPETAAQALLTHDDDTAALTAARRLARSARAPTPEVQARRIRAALARRGFRFDTVEGALAKLSEEAVMAEAAR